MPDIRTNPDYIAAVLNSYDMGVITEQQRDELLTTDRNALN